MRVPPKTPGMIPATKSWTTELSDMTAYRIMGIDGGMMMAMVAEDEVTAAANPLGYPLRLMAGMRIEPRAATSATAEPDISAKNMEAATFTMHLEAGPVLLHTWFDDERRQPLCGAYYVYARRVP